MLDYMRKSSNSLLMYIVFGALAVVFALSFGPGSSGFSTAEGESYAAIVNGEAISAQEYQITYRRRRDQITRQLGGNSFGLEQFLDRLPQQVIDGMISGVLLKQEADELGLVVSDQELADYLAANVFTSDDDGVTPQVYRDWVRSQFGMTVAEYEQQLRDDLVGEKVRKTIEANVAVSDEEVKTAYLLENNKAKVTFVRFATKAGADAPAATEQEIDAAIADQRDALEERYNKDIFKYRNPEQRKVRQILKELPEGADDVAVAKLRAEIVSLKEQLEGGADFAAIAKAQSDDASSKDNGGDIGFVKRGTLARELETAIFTTAQDVISEPVQTNRGWHLVQVTEIQPSSNKPFDEVIREVARGYVEREKASTAARQEAEAFLAEVQGGASFEELTVSEEEQRERREDPAMKDARVRVTSPWILKTQDSVPRVGNVEGLVDEIFALDPASPLIPRVVESNGTCFVMKLDERVTPDLTQFEERKEALRETEISKKRTRVVEDWLENLRDKATIQYNPSLFETEPASA